MTRKIRIFKGIRVLMVDDNHDTRDIVCTYLENGGAIVTCAESAAEALILYVSAERPFDVLVSDLGMPNRDGLWLVHQLKAKAREAAHPLWAVALTAHAFDNVREAAMNAGFDVYLTKPFEFEDLANAVILRPVGVLALA